ncbi:hypothetical protein LWI28_022490 [Acer negundo]|uniref:Pentatricopeptide repeat-containing protein n=1 Tax=Acer negundo TaxID=4023 RepID=A0AAD5J710_ACENE|nr:hypothetical protein LWI28_022490 [Acer negundo]
MRDNGVQVDSFTVPTVLKACSLLQLTQLGKEIHGFAIKNGLDCDVFVSNASIKMYAECGCIVSARLVFDEMSSRDIVSWSTMIGSYHKSRLFDEALNVVREMRFWRVRPSEFAMISMVGLFADIGDVEAGRIMHACVIRNSASEKLGVAMATTLIDMYAKCGDIGSAKRVFDGLDERSVVSWTAMIAGCISCNNFRESSRLFVEMLGENVFPTEVTILSLIIECGFVGSLGLGKFLHAYILRNGFDMSLAVATALVDMYGKCGEIRSARALFDSMKIKDVMTWSAMISAYAQAHCTDKAFELFVQMKGNQVSPNEVTIVTLLTLCAEAGALDKGKWIHAYAKKQGIEADVILETALVDMYAKCGDINGAYRLFSEAKGRDICMWNAMMAGYGMHGHCKEALELFGDMERLGVKPNNITFIGLLNACSHAGLVAEGKKLFEKMVCDFGLVPKIEHYGCMVDLLGRAGLLDEAHEMIKSMPLRLNTIVWGALLAASKLHKNRNIAEVATRELLEMEPQSRGYNVLMSNIYAEENRWNDVARVRRDMKDTRVRREPGVSSVEVNGSVCEFVTGDTAQTQNLYA